MVATTRKAVWPRRFAAAAWLRPLTGLVPTYLAAFEAEWSHRRFFLWLPVLCGTGVLLYLGADREPVLWLPLLLAAVFASLAFLARNNRAAFMLAVGLAAVFVGFSAAGIRSWRVGGPVLDRIRIAKLTGQVEEVDGRRVGKRFILRVEDGGVLDAAHKPYRVRLTTRRDDPIQAGDKLALTARLLPPASASLPDGYAFSRDAYFAGLGAVGSMLGKPRPTPLARDPGWTQSILMAVDRVRNALATRVDQILGGDRGAIGAAMVTGKRDLLSADGRDLIREAGIFHIITIAGVQMTLVAGLLFGGLRRGLALSRTLALAYPIKKWAALGAIAGAIAYDVLTGSRIGTQRALIMTVVMLGAVLVDRRGFTMRNLALSALLVVLIEPEAITGASFQLSFAAVAALVAVYEGRMRRRETEGAEELPRGRDLPAGIVWGRISKVLHHGRDLLIATFCATGATASFMAANFHELSPYVLLGNPLTLAIIEFFAVPGALLGSVLYPLGLDGLVWHWVGAGIDIVLWVARLIAAAPGATIHLPAFAPWALPFLSLAVLSAVIWRTVPFRLTAIPLAVIGLCGTALGPHYDMIVSATGDAVAVRRPDGYLELAGKTNGFAAEQWLRADADGRDAADLRPHGSESLQTCDHQACVVALPDHQVLSLVSDRAAFEEDCRRADVIVTPLYAPESCAAPLIIDRGSLAITGALGLTLNNGGWVTQPSRQPTEDRPWSPLRQPFARFRPAANRPAATRPGPAPEPSADATAEDGGEPEDGALTQP